MKSRWAYSLRAEASVLEIDIYDVIGAGFMGGISAQDILGQLKTSKDAKQILVRINSGGGEVTQGMAIYSLLREAAQNGADVVCRIDGLAASIATIIACAGTKIEMADSAFFMIHNPSAMVEGAEGDLRSMADLLSSMKQQMLSIYAERTGKPVEELAALCDAETWMTAEEALSNGFITDIIPARTASMAARAKWDLTQFKKVPKGLGAKKMDEKDFDALKAENEELKARLQKLEDKFSDKDDEDEDAKDSDDEDEGEDKPKKKSDDDQDGDEDEDEKDAKASAQSRVLAAAKAVTGVKDLEALEGALYALSTKAKGTRSSKAVHAEKVSRAITEGKLMPSQKTWALSASTKAFDSYLTSLGDNVVGPVGQEFRPNEPEAKARTEKDLPKSELSKSEKALAKAMKLSDDDLIKLKASA